MSTVKSGDTVKVHYTGKLDNGEVFDSSEGAEPLAFTVGAGEVIPGFDQALLGMQVGETKDVVIEPEQAYGNRIEELVMVRDLPAGEPDATVTLDANHLLAGETLHFSLTLVEIAA